MRRAKAAKLGRGWTPLDDFHEQRLALSELADSARAYARGAALVVGQVQSERNAVFGPVLAELWQMTDDELCAVMDGQEHGSEI